MSAAQRSAALRHWASVDDPAAQTAAGRAKFLDSFEQKATPKAATAQRSAPKGPSGYAALTSSSWQNARPKHAEPSH